MRRISLFGLTAAMVLLVGAVGVRAQEPPVDPAPVLPVIQPVPYIPGICSNPRFDIDGDGRLSKLDILAWEQQAMRQGCIDEQGREIPGGCNGGKLDVNGDGRVNIYDLGVLYNNLYTCLFPVSPRTRP